MHDTCFDLFKATIFTSVLRMYLTPKTSYLHLIEREMPGEMKHCEGIFKGWKGFTAIIFSKGDIVKVFILEDYESNKWVSKSPIHGGFIDRFREVKCA